MSSRERLEYQKRLRNLILERSRQQSLLKESKKETKSEELDLSRLDDESDLTKPIALLGDEDDSMVSRLSTSKDAKEIDKKEQENLDKHDENVEDVLALKEVVRVLVREFLQEKKKRLKKGSGGKKDRVKDTLVKQGYDKEEAEESAESVVKKEKQKKKSLKTDKKKKTKDELRLTFR
jgi:hypothetical protein